MNSFSSLCGRLFLAKSLSFFHLTNIHILLNPSESIVFTDITNFCQKYKMFKMAFQTSPNVNTSPSFATGWCSWIFWLLLIIIIQVLLSFGLLCLDRQVSFFYHHHHPHHYHPRHHPPHNHHHNYHHHHHHHSHAFISKPPEIREVRS